MFPRDLPFLCAALLVLPCALVGQHRMTPEMLWKLHRVSDPQISEDGKFLLYTVRRYDLKQNFRKQASSNSQYNSKQPSKKNQAIFHSVVP